MIRSSSQVAVRRQVPQQLGQGRAQPFAGRPIQHRPALQQQLHRFRTVYTWWATHAPEVVACRGAGRSGRHGSPCGHGPGASWSPRTRGTLDKSIV